MRIENFDFALPAEAIAQHRRGRAMQRGYCASGSDLKIGWFATCRDYFGRAICWF